MIGRAAPDDVTIRVGETAAFVVINATATAAEFAVVDLAAAPAMDGGEGTDGMANMPGMTSGNAPAVGSLQDIGRVAVGPSGMQTLLVTFDQPGQYGYRVASDAVGVITVGDA